MEIAMRKAAHVVALALAALCLGLIAAMPIVAGWSMPAEQALPALPINPLKLMEQAKHLQARQITDFSTIH
jgi:predicted benzoate:H+ symporter BenE